MTSAALESSDARRHFNAARDAKDRDALDPHTANAVAKVRRDREARDRRFRQWDNDAQTEEFLAWLNERNWRLENAWPALPNADEAEQAALGAMLQERSALRHGLQTLHIAHLRRPAHRHILRAIAQVRQYQAQGQRVVVDLITVTNELKRVRAFDESGGFDYLRYCVSECPNTHNIRNYCAAIVEASRQRYLFLLGQALQVEALNAYESGHLMNALRNAADAIETRGYCDLKSIFETSK